MSDAERLAAIPWFAALDAPMRAALIAQGRWRRVAAGEWLYGEGDEDAGLVAVIEGGLGLYAQAPGGREALVGAVPAGAVIGQGGAAAGGSRLLTAIAGEPSQVFLLGDGALRRVAAVHPELWRSLSVLAYEHNRRLIETLAAVVGLRPRQRLIFRLLTLSGGGSSVRLSQAALAEMTGVSRKAVNDWLGELERAGQVTRRYGVVVVRDRAGLQRRLEA
jgi:CRP/FNR family transcriptional regulator, cyclic AMP receptor protein